MKTNDEIYKKIEVFNWNIGISLGIIILIILISLYGIGYEIDNTNSKINKIEKQLQILNKDTK